jgi:hypothetical protein
MDEVTSVYRWHRRLFTTLSSPVSGHLSPVTFGLLPGISAALRQDDRPYDILRIPGEIHRIRDDVQWPAFRFFVNSGYVITEQADSH